MRKIMTSVRCIHVFFFTALFVFSSALSADVAIIVHKTNMLDSIDTDMLKSVYLGKLKTWPNGQPIALADNEPGSDIRRLFLKKIIKKSERKYDNYWSKRVYSGKGMAPKAMTDDTEIKQWVSKNKNSIAFIDVSSIDKTIKVLLKIK